MSEAAPANADAEPASAADFEQLYFGPGCYGVLHRPPLGAARDLGLVICKPFGYEAMCAHRSLRHLAERAAAAGVPALRFDYPGTGDAAGDPRDPGQVASWLAGIAAAVAELEARAGVRRVCLFGLRLGATLAAVAGAQSPVDAIILWAPAKSGTAFLREFRALQALQATSDAREEGVLEAVGYPIPAETKAALAAIDLTKLTRAPAPRALFLSRDDLKEDESLPEALRALGVAVERRAPGGYAAMMRDANYAVVPEAALAEIASWVAALAGPPLGNAPAPGAPTLALSEGGAALVERAVRFGPDGRLCGILTEPAAPGRERGIVFINVGANHHVGPNRLYVVMARQLAAHGHPVVRFDVAGLGDSPALADQEENEMYSLDHCRDVSAAIDLLSARGATSFALAGICSGAFLAFHTAVADERVSALTLINQQTFQWRKGDSIVLALRRQVNSLRFYQAAIFQADTWKRFLTGKVDVGTILRAFSLRAARRLARPVLALRSWLSGGPFEHSEIARKFYGLQKRGARILLVFSASDAAIDVMEEHLGSMGHKLRGRGDFHVEVIDGPDHTFTPIWSQRLLADLVREWMEKP